MLATKQSLYTADTSPTESAHSGLKMCQKVHSLASTHNLGTPGQQLRLKRSVMRFNWNNLPFDLRTNSDAQEQGTGAEASNNNMEDLTMYIQGEEPEVECGVCESVKQVASEYHSIQTIFKIIGKLRSAG